MLALPSPHLRANYNPGLRAAAGRTYSPSDRLDCLSRAGRLSGLHNTDERKEHQCCLKRVGSAKRKAGVNESVNARTSVRQRSIEDCTCSLQCDASPEDHDFSFGEIASRSGFAAFSSWP